MAAFKPNSDLTHMRKVNVDWATARGCFAAAAEARLRSETDATVAAVAAENCSDALSAFSSPTRDIDTTVCTRMLDVLKTFYAGRAGVTA